MGRGNPPQLTMTANIKNLLIQQMRINDSFANPPTPKSKPDPQPVVVIPARSGINANTATADELAALPRLGASRAQMIIAGRPWANASDIAKRVRGISERMLRDWDMYCD